MALVRGLMQIIKHGSDWYSPSRHMTAPRKWHFQTATFTPKGQGYYWALYKAVYFTNGAATSVPEERAVMMCLWLTTREWF